MTEKKALPKTLASVHHVHAERPRHATLRGLRGT
jgi:hypothetical protein